MHTAFACIRVHCEYMRVHLVCIAMHYLLRAFVCVMCALKCIHDVQECKGMQRLCKMQRMCDVVKCVRMQRVKNATCQQCYQYARECIQTRMQHNVR